MSCHQRGREHGRWQHSIDTSLCVKASPFRGICRATPSECRGAVGDHALALLQADSTCRARVSISILCARASTDGGRPEVVEHPRKSRSRKLPRIGQRFGSGQPHHLCPLQAGRVDTRSVPCRRIKNEKPVEVRRGRTQSLWGQTGRALSSLSVGRSRRDEQSPLTTGGAQPAPRVVPRLVRDQEGTRSGPFDCPSCGRPH